MPFVSQAQRAKFYADPKLRKYVADFEAATPKGAKLPKHVGDKSSNIHEAAVAHMKRRK
jgi:hypothetical protein